jgi:hypothetical protein
MPALVFGGQRGLLARPDAGSAAGPGRPASARELSRRIRAWAKDQGIAVSDRGRIPAGIAEQYDVAHK